MARAINMPTTGREKGFMLWLSLLFPTEARKTNFCTERRASGADQLHRRRQITVDDRLNDLRETLGGMEDRRIVGTLGAAQPAYLNQFPQPNIGLRW